MRGLEHRNAELADVGAALERAEVEARRLAERVQAAEAAVEEQQAAWVREKEYAATRRAELLKQYDEVKEQRDKIAQLGPEGECPTCRRPLGGEHAAVLGILDRQLQAIVEDGKYFRQRLEQVAEPPAAVGLLEGQRDGLREESRRASERAGAVGGGGSWDGRFRAARDRYDRALGTRRGAELALVEAGGDLTRAEGDMQETARREEERAARERDIALRKTRHRLHNELDRAFSDLRAELNAAMRPEIAELASDFLADLTDGRYQEIDLNEDYEITILDGGVPKPVISGGEEDVANLVLRLAISQMIAERAGQPLSLLVLDEIFGSLDEAPRQHVVALLRRPADRL